MDMKVVAYYPYECGAIMGSCVSLPMSPAMKEWRKELSHSVGKAYDNKVTFTLVDIDGKAVGVQFWDNVVYIGGGACVNLPDKAYYLLGLNGKWQKVGE